MRGRRPRTGCGSRASIATTSMTSNPGTGLFPRLRRRSAIASRTRSRTGSAIPNTYPLVIVQRHRAGGLCPRAARAVPRARSRASTTAWRSSSLRAPGGASASAATRRAAHPQPLRRALGDQRISAQRRRGELLAPRGRRLHRRAATRSASSTAKCTRCLIPRSRARRRPRSRAQPPQATLPREQRAAAAARARRSRATPGSVAERIEHAQPQRADISRQALNSDARRAPARPTSTLLQQQAHAAPAPSASATR